MKKIYLLITFCVVAFCAKSQTLIAIKDVSKHLNENVTICDSVYSSRALAGLTLLNLGDTFPKQLLTLVIYKDNLSKFTEPEKNFLNKKICITGKLVEYNGKPQIVITDPKQITLVKP